MSHVMGKRIWPNYCLTMVQTHIREMMKDIHHYILPETGSIVELFI